MQDTITVIVTLAGLLFSLCFALLLEEFLFGGVCQFFFGPVRSESERTGQSSSAHPIRDAGGCNNPQESDLVAISSKRQG